jgi:DNA sulfur modification protein DndD
LNKYQLESDTKLNLKEGIAKILTQYSGEVINEDTLLNIRKEEYDSFMSVYHNLKGSYQLELNNLIDDYKQNKIKIDKLNRKIHQAQIEASDNHIKNLKIESGELHQEIASLEKEIYEINQEIGILKAHLTKTNEALSKYQHRIQVLKSDAEKNNLVSQLIEELDIFLKSLKQGKKKSLSVTIKRILNSLMHKDGFIQEVQLDDDCGSLNISLIDSNGEEIKKNSLSKGEQQLYASALLQALVEESGIEFPVFIDSPLQKFDERHTKTIITKFYPNISKQVVLFPIYGKELTNNEYKLLAPIVIEQYDIQNTDEGSKIIKVNQCSHRLGLAR